MPAIKDKLECLVWSILVNIHRFEESRARRLLGYREPAQKMAASQSYQGTESGFCGATHPGMGFKLYLVK